MKLVAGMQWHRAANEISLHRLRVLLYLEKADGWRTNAEIAKSASVAPRTARARAHTKALVDLGILGQAEVFPAHRYRISEHAMTRNKMYMIRLKKAAEVFGLP